MTSAPFRILVYVGLDLLGDGLIKLAFIRALRAAFPDAHVTWLAGQGKTVFAASLRPLVHGLLDEVIEDAGIGRSVYELLRRPMPGQHFDFIIDTQSSVLTTLIIRRIGHKTFFSATAGYIFSDRRPAAPSKSTPLARRLLDLVELASGCPAALHGEPPLPDGASALARELLPEGPVYVGLLPGAGGRHKCWPLHGFIALARHQVELGRVPVFILGPSEREWLPIVQAAVPEARLPLQDIDDPSPLLTIALAGRLSAAVANDAGGGHLMAVGGAPLVSLFGPTDPEKFAACARQLVIVRAQQFGGTAMSAIPVDAVKAAVETLLERGFAPILEASASGSQTSERLSPGRDLLQPLTGC